MTNVEFVEAVKLVAARASSRGTIEALVRPPGRKPDPDLVELSQWFGELDERGRHAVARVADLVSDQAVYNTLLVLDGLLAVEGRGEKGHFELIHVKDETRTLLNSPDDESLSGIYKDVG